MRATSHACALSRSHKCTLTLCSLPNPDCANTTKQPVFWQAAGLGGILDSGNSITMFAPINSAFNCSQYEVWHSLIPRHRSLDRAVTS